MSGPTARNVDECFEGAAPATSGCRDRQARTCGAAKEIAGEVAGEAVAEAVGEAFNERVGAAAGEADLDALFGPDCRELRKLFSIGC